MHMNVPFFLNTSCFALESSNSCTLSTGAWGSTILFRWEIFKGPGDRTGGLSKKFITQWNFHSFNSLSMFSTTVYVLFARWRFKKTLISWQNFWGNSVTKSQMMQRWRTDSEQCQHTCILYLLLIGDQYFYHCICHAMQAWQGGIEFHKHQLWTESPVWRFIGRAHCFLPDHW